MKAIFLVLFLGAATAFPDHAMQHACNGLVRDFVKGMDKAPSLRSVMNMPSMTELDLLENDIKIGLETTLQELLDHLMGKLKEMYDQHLIVGKEFLQEIAKVLEVLKKFGIDLKDRMKDLINQIGGNLHDRLVEIYNRIFNQTSLSYSSVQMVKSLDLGNILRMIKEKIVEKLDVETIVNYIRERFAKHKELREKLIEGIRNGGKELLKDLLDLILHDGSKGPAHGIADMWNRMKDYFGGLGLEIKARWLEFGKFLQDIFGKGLEAIKEKIPKLREIAEKLIETAKTNLMTREVAIQALEFVKLYKDELGGDLFERVVTALQRVLSS